MIYPENLIDKLSKLDIVNYYIAPTFGPILRRFGYIQRAFGGEIITKLYGIENPTFGPNARADVILQMNLGYFGVIFTVFSGYIVAKIRKIKTKNIFIIYITGILIVNIETILTDFTLFSMLLFSFLLIMPILYFSTKCITTILENKC